VRAQAGRRADGFALPTEDAPEHHGHAQAHDDAHDARAIADVGKLFMHRIPDFVERHAASLRLVA